MNTTIVIPFLSMVLFLLVGIACAAMKRLTRSRVILLPLYLLPVWCILAGIPHANSQSLPPREQASAPDGDFSPRQASGITVGVARVTIRDLLQKRQLVNIPDEKLTFFETKSVKLTSEVLSFDADRVTGTARTTINVRLVFKTLDYVAPFKARPSSPNPFIIVSSKWKEFQKQVGDELVLAFADEETTGRFADALNRLINEAYLSENGLLSEKSHGMLGTYLMSVGPKMKKSLGLKTDSGAGVLGVSPGGAGEKAGLKYMDVITGLNGAAITSPMALRVRLMTTLPGEDVTLDMIRNGAPQQVKAHLDASQSVADNLKWWRERPAHPKPEALEKSRIIAEQAVKENDYIKALSNYEAGLAAYPLWAEGWFNAAVLYAAMGEYEYATKRMRTYLELMPDAPDAKAAREKLIIWEEKARN